MKYEAFFISPDSKIIPVETFHIERIIESPELFGFTGKRIAAIYKRHGERLPVEGAARLEILKNLIRHRWVRVRYKPREDSFTIQVWSIDARVKRQLKKFVSHITKKPENVPKYTGYELSEIRTNGIIVSGTLKDWIRRGR